MSKIIFDQEGSRNYETGVSKGVLYPKIDGTYGKGVAFNGLTAVTESPSGAEATPLYADNIKYLNLISAEEFGATVEAYTYPDEFSACNGEGSLGLGVSIGQQKRSPFALCYRTEMGDDSNPNKGYKIHLIYGAQAAPSERAYSTINDSPEAISFSWELSTTPVEAGEGNKPTACLVIDSTKVNAEALKEIEDALYGTDAGPEGSPEATEPKLLLPADIAAILKKHNSMG